MSRPDPPERLEQILGGDELAWIRDRVRFHVAAGRALPGVLTLREPNVRQRRAVATLLGRPPTPAGSVRVAPATIDALLTRSGAWNRGLVAAVEALDGPIAITAQEGERSRLRWEAAFAPLDEAVARALDRVASSSAYQLAHWRAELKRSGRVRSVTSSADEAAVLLGRLSRVLDALPAQGEPLGVFAARVLDFAHDLDDGMPLAALAAGAAAALGGVSVRDDGVSEADWRREVWAAVGVLRDELSTRVLVLGLPARGSSSTARVLNAGRQCGQPVVLTLRQLARDTYDRPSNCRMVSSCENASVMAVAADRLGVEAMALVCTEANPVPRQRC